MFKFPFTSMNKLSIFIIALSTLLFAIPSFVPLLGLFLQTFLSGYGSYFLCLACLLIFLLDAGIEFHGFGSWTLL